MSAKRVPVSREVLLLCAAVVCFAVLFVGAAAAEEQEQHAFQSSPTGGQGRVASDAEMMNAIRTILLRSLRSPRYHGGARRFDYVKRFPEVNARGFESDIFDEGFGDFSPVRRR